MKKITKGIRKVANLHSRTSISVKAAVKKIEKQVMEKKHGTEKDKDK